jgi:hypothetical protein
VERAKELHEDCCNFYVSTEDNCGDLELNYERLETDEEYKLRLKQEEKAKKVQDERRKKKEEKELAMLKRLKEKYEAN